MPDRRTILFVDGLWVEKSGIMSLIPHLERAGNRVLLLLTRNDRRLLRAVARIRPDIVAFSVTTGYHVKALAMARRVRAAFPQVRILMGGPHVTYYPEMALDPAVDLAFRGECDRTLPDALDMLDDGAPPESIPNLVFPLPGEGRTAAGPSVGTGPLAPLVEDLDSLPFPDREHYYRARFFRNSPYKSFIVSRGCPHDCAFCFNRKLRDMYRGKGRFLRLRSPESVVEEAVSVRDRYGMRLASFEDDLLTWDRNWLERLLPLWRDRVRVPYNINATAPALADPSLVELLADTGAGCVAFGLECGNEELRNRVLNKPVLDEHVRTAARQLRRHGLSFLTYNMFALPGETFEDAVSTLRLNREIGTRLARCTLFQPYPGTALGDAAGTPSATGEMLYARTPLDGPDARRIERLQKYAIPAMRSRLGERLAVLASLIPASPVHEAVFWATYFDVVRRYMRTGYLHLLELGARSLTDLA